MTADIASPGRASEVLGVVERGRSLETKLVTKPTLPPFYYVIFADGETCDATGLEAAFGNDFVVFDGRLYMPGETISIIGRTLLLRRVAEGKGGPGGRLVEICHCTIINRIT